MGVVLKISKALMRLLDRIACVLLVLITVVDFINVIMRYVFAQPIGWVGEMSVLSMVWMVYLSQGMLESDDDQLKMTAIYRLFRPSVKYLVNGLRTALTVFIFGYLLFYGSDIIARNFRLKTTTQALGFPLWIAYLALPVTFVIICIARILDPLVSHSENAPTVVAEDGGK